MRKGIAFICFVVFLFALEGPGLAQVEDFSKGRLLGIGIEATFSSKDAPFPASGLSTRLWFADLLGLEVNISVVAGGPSFTMRSFLKFFNTEIVDFYGGAGVAFFGPGAKTALQILGGLEISMNRRVAINSEVGASFAFSDGKITLGVTAGVGLHFYF